jgi:DNA-binding CsgD family transcriptional regulator
MRVDFSGETGASLDIPAPAMCRIAVTTRPNPKTADLALLTDGQRDCLRLVYQHMTSKDIARVLGVSPHTVDMRLRTAMRTLQVANRIDAARLLVKEEAGGDVMPDVYQPLIYQSPELVPPANPSILTTPASGGSDDTDPSRFGLSPDVGPPASGPPRLAGASMPNYREHPVDAADAMALDSGRMALASAGPLAGSFRDSAAIGLPWGRRNNLSVGLRVAWIFLIAVGSALGFGAVLAAMAALKSLI